MKAQSGHEQDEIRALRELLDETAAKVVTPDIQQSQGDLRLLISDFEQLACADDAVGPQATTPIAHSEGARVGLKWGGAAEGGGAWLVLNCPEFDGDGQPMVTPRCGNTEELQNFAAEVVREIQSAVRQPKLTS